MKSLETFIKKQLKRYKKNFVDSGSYYWGYEEAMQNVLDHIKKRQKEMPLIPKNEKKHGRFCQMRWIKTEKELPEKDGKYWVYPFKSSCGWLIVGMADFCAGKWCENPAKQNYRFWKPIKRPLCPKE